MTASLNPFSPAPGSAYTPIGSSFSVTLGKMLDAGREADPSASELPYIRAGNIQDTGLDLSSVNTMPFTESEAATLDLRRGDVLVVEGGAVGTCVVLGTSLSGWSFQKTVNRVRPVGDSSSRYLAYILRAYRDAGIIDIVCNKSTIPHLTAEKLRALRIPSWAPAEQRAIADYLDCETARIDTLIAEQQRLIELLRERRQAVIGVAVIDGSLIDPTYVGPSSHWQRGKIKNAFEVILGKMLQSSDTGDDVLADYMRAANVQPDGALKLDAKQMWFRPGELEELSLRRGDVVVVEGGVGGYGRAAYLSHDLDGWGFQNSINRLRPRDAAEARFLAYYLIAVRAAGFIERYCNVVSMPHLTAEKLNALPIPLPPHEEQRRIADYLDEQTAKIDTLVAEAERFIDLSRERRAALITAAVTGQIDVRARVA